MNADDAQRMLEGAGLILKEKRRSANDRFDQLRFESGEVVNIYNNGTVSPQGQNQEHVRKILGLDAARLLRVKDKSNSPIRECFVLMPLAGEFDDLYRYAIKPAVESAGFACSRADEIADLGSILDSVIKRIAYADLVIVDVSKANPNVFYELGIAHSLAKNVLIIAQDVDDIPFDIRHQRAIVYRSVRALEEGLKAYLFTLPKAIDASSPVLTALPELEAVPKTAWVEAKRRIKELETELAERKTEIGVLRSAQTGHPDLIALKDELKSHLDSLEQRLLLQRDGELEHLRIEFMKREEEVRSARASESELRRLKKMTLVNPHWQARRFDVDPGLCFLLMPFREEWSDDLWSLIDGIVKQCGLKCERADEKDGRIVMNDIWEGISRARVIIADLTSKNPNVTYEVGLADVLGKDVVLLSQTPQDVPFDFLGVRLITYENSLGGVKKLTTELGKRLANLRPIEAANLGNPTDDSV
jgi:hypothetical protein